MVELWRDPIVESVHFGAAAVANANGEIIDGWGDVDVITYPRSSLKPVQAIALVETGAARAFELTQQHLALACASHRGEPFHTELASSWLENLSLDEDALACGPDLPADPKAMASVMRSGGSARRVYHNCSGKHCGFLTVSRHHAWPIEGYNELQHPSQQLYLEALSELAACDASRFAFGVDGCTLPAVALPLSTMARAMARFAAARASSPGRRSAMQAIHEAMRMHPEYVSGTDQPSVLIARATRGRVIVKTGAEGYMMVYAPEQGIAVTLKIADGTARPRTPALIAILSATRLLDESEGRELVALAEPAVLDSAGRKVGRLRTSLPQSSIARASEPTR
jgi:L-asparaginase II